MNSAPDLFTALEFEEIEFAQALKDWNETRKRKIESLRAECASRGLYNSGIRLKGEDGILWDTLSECVNKVIGVRKEMGVRVPQLLEHEHLNSLERKLKSLVDSAMSAHRSALQDTPALGRAALNGERDFRALAVKQRITEELTKVALASRLGMHTPPNNPLTVNISQSNIAALNLGTIVGDIHGAIHNLYGAGHQDLADAIKKLIEALTQTSEMTHQVKREMLEHLAFVASESSVLPEHRKMAPLRASIKALQTGLGVASQIVGLWNAVASALTSAGVSF